MSPEDGGVEWFEGEAALKGAAPVEIIVGAGERQREERREEKRESERGGEEIGHGGENLGEDEEPKRNTYYKGV